MTSRTVKTMIVVLMLLAVALYLISGTYARYASEATGSATVQVAKWSVAVAKQDISETAGTFNVTITPNENEFVEEGKIAPASSATGTIEVDLTGTEVAVDISMTIEEAKLKDLFGEAKVTATAKIGEGEGAKEISGTEPTVISLSEIKANPVMNVTLDVVWENDEAKNAIDTGIGVAAGNKVIPITLKVQQHIAP